MLPLSHAWPTCVSLIGRRSYCQNAAGYAAVSPEDCDIAGIVGSFCAWRDANRPGLEVWLSEFGYDTASGGSDVSITALHIRAMLLLLCIRVFGCADYAGHRALLC